MRRPTRTRRLSIAAALSLLAFVAVAGIGVRSFWIGDGWTYGDRQKINFGLARGLIAGGYLSVPPEITIPSGHQSSHWESFETPSPVFPFFVTNKTYHLSSGDLKIRGVWVSLWLPLLLLLIAPVRWLVARPKSTAAFPVIAGAKQERVRPEF